MGCTVLFMDTMALPDLGPAVSSRFPQQMVVIHSVAHVYIHACSHFSVFSLARFSLDLSVFKIDGNIIVVMHMYSIW